MKTYQGRRTNGRIIVTVNGRPLDSRLDLLNHSPTGFEWGYGGSGPAQLALAVLADCLHEDDMAVALHHEFKFAVIAHLPHEGWTLTGDEIRATVENLTRASTGSSDLDAIWEFVRADRIVS